MILDKNSNEVELVGHRHNKVYRIKLNDVVCDNICLVANDDENAWLWHHQLGHDNFRVISKLSRHYLVIGLPKCFFNCDEICGAYAKGKQTRISFKSKNVVFTFRHLELFHLDSFRLTTTFSLHGKNYRFVIVDDC